MKVSIDELRAHEASSQRLGVVESWRGLDLYSQGAGERGAILVIDDNERQIHRIVAALGSAHRVATPNEAVSHEAVDLVIVALSARRFDGLKVIARVRSQERLRHVPILGIVEPDDAERSLRALDIGAHDIIHRPLDEEELAARVRTLIRRKRYMEALRTRLDHGLELAVTDQLTGLYNRRFLLNQMGGLVQRANHGGSPVSVMIADIDHFKRINDGFGHDVGDAVLKEFALRMASTTRPSDFVCRLGGEEFVVLMPACDGPTAAIAGERLRRAIAAAGFTIPGAGQIDVTASIGVATAGAGCDTAETLLKRADDGLYRAKALGRNRVIGQARSAIAAVAGDPT